MNVSSPGIKAQDIWDILKSAVDDAGSMGESALGLAPLTQLAGNTPGGDWVSNPAYLYDGNLATNGYPGAAGQYAEQLFGTLCLLHDFSIRWLAANTAETGRWKIQYLTLYGVWTDIKTDIPTVDADVWTDYENLVGFPLAKGVRFYCTTYDVNSRQIAQLEVRGKKLE